MDSVSGTNLPPATGPNIVEIDAGDTFEMSIERVRKRIGNADLAMLAYNRSIPGPTLRVVRGSQVTVRVTNRTDMETTVHWHGLRLENAFDGVPHETQKPIPSDGTFSYRLHFPDAGFYWYHPHMREDYAQEMGLYGAIIVVPESPDYWPPVHREIPLMLDDILLDGGQIAGFGGDNMGRFGNVYLVNGGTAFELAAERGEVVRFYLVNTANVRNFKVGLPGASMKLIGGDSGRCEVEQLVDEIGLAPGERAVVDVLFARPGSYTLDHRRSQGPLVLGTITVADRVAQPLLEDEYRSLRRDQELQAERLALAADFDRKPDKVLELVGEMPGMVHGAHEASGQEMPAASPAGEMDHEAMHANHSAAGMGQVAWKLVDTETGAVNQGIEWTFTLGERVKVRLISRSDADHPMPHPFHVHGERFLILSRDGARNSNLMWKDTVLVESGETVDILIDLSNPGLWMAHCHIAEHSEAGMMFQFRVA